MPNRNVLLAATVLAALPCSTVAGAGSGQTMQSLPEMPSPPFERGQVSVVQNRLLRDGRPWVPHGIGLVAFEVGPAVRAQHRVFGAAYEHYLPEEFRSIRAWGADSVRIQVAQPAVDPAGPQFDPRFLATVVAATRAARAAGLVVILSMQDEPQSGDARRDDVFLPDRSTDSAWRALSAEFSQDRGVIYEIFNEPRIAPTPGENPARPTPAHWRTWATAMEATIRTLRAGGSRNVMVVDGLAAAQTLADAPALSAEAGQVAYAVHPYFQTRVRNDPAGWTIRFGDFARSRPVIVTEWNTAVGRTCDQGTPGLALEFLRYTERAGIGIEPYAYDFVQPGYGAIVTGFAAGGPNPPTTFVGQSCVAEGAGRPRGSADFGAGATIQALYRTGAVPAAPL